MFSEEWFQLGYAGAMGIALLYTINKILKYLVGFIKEQSKENNKARRKDAKINAKAVKQLTDAIREIKK